MANIIEASDLPEGEKIYLKKDYFGWRIVNPLRNPDGTWNWVNMIFGGWRNFASLIAILALIGIFMWVYNHDVTAVRAYYENACLMFKGGSLNLTG